MEKDILFNLNYIASDFYTDFTPLKEKVRVPAELEEYTGELSKYVNRVLCKNTDKINFDFDFVKNTIETKKVELDDKVAILLYSSGVDSTFAMLNAVEKYDTVILVFVEHLNPSISSREKKSAVKLAEKFGCQLEILHHHKDLRRLHRVDLLLQERKLPLLESQVKNQYAQFLCIPLIEKYRAKTFIIPMDLDGDSDLNDEDMSFSDSRESYDTFHKFFKTQLL